MRIRRIESGDNFLPLRPSLEKLNPGNSDSFTPLRCHHLWTCILTFLSGKLTLHCSSDSNPSLFFSNFLLFTTPPPTTPFLLVFFPSCLYVFLSQHIIILVSPKILGCFISILHSHHWEKKVRSEPTSTPQSAVHVLPSFLWLCFIFCQYQSVF